MNNPTLSPVAPFSVRVQALLNSAKRFREPRKLFTRFLKGRSSPKEDQLELELEFK